MTNTHFILSPCEVFSLITSEYFTSHNMPDAPDPLTKSEVIREVELATLEVIMSETGVTQ